MATVEQPPLGCRARIELSERAPVAWRGPAAAGPMALYNQRPPPKGAGAVLTVLALRPDSECSAGFQVVYNL